MSPHTMQVRLQQLAAYQQEVEAELVRLTDFWLTKAVNPAGNFISRMHSNGEVDSAASQGGILQARILWSFSAVYRHTGQEEHRAAAARALDYLLAHFLDHEHGGIYWLLDAQGQPLDTRKQIYALAFAIYGLSEYHRATQCPLALQVSQELFRWVERHSFDVERGGYFEAFGRRGEPLADMRLSEKDLPAPKTMNTHLHVLEAYANLYRIWPDAGLGGQLRGLLTTFLSHIVDAETGHLHLFFTADWHPIAELESYGHDIEAAWLLREAAEVLGDENLLVQVNAAGQQLTQATAVALLPDGSLPHELNRRTGHLDLHREWWVSAEAMVGFLNAYELSQDELMLRHSRRAWQFAKQHLLDYAHGEWHWGVDADYLPLAGQDKVGFWKCPYHNMRACLEVVERCQKEIARLKTLPAFLPA